MKKKYVTKKIKIQCLEYCIYKLENMPIWDRVFNEIIPISYGICYCINKFDTEFHPIDSIEYSKLIPTYLPELIKYRPQNRSNGVYWFALDEEGNKKRITICKKVLKELKNK
jgi:hypothetical protein